MEKNDFLENKGRVLAVLEQYFHKKKKKNLKKEKIRAVQPVRQDKLQSGCRILIVTASYRLSKSIEQHFEKNQKVYSLGSYDDFEFNKALKFNSDVILLDSDFKTAQEESLALFLVFKKVLPGIPVIIIKGEDRQLLSEFEKREDVDGFVIKPVDLKRLTQKISAALKSKVSEEPGVSPELTFDKNKSFKDVDFKLTTGHGFTVIRLTGKVKTNNLLDLKKEFELLIENKINNIALDLEEVNFVDSSGLGLFVNFYKKVKDHQGMLCILNPSVNVSQILQQTGVDRIISILFTDR